MANSIDPSLGRFNTLLPQLEGGALNDDLTDAVQRCVSDISEACHDRGGKHKATITLTLTFTMDQKDKVVEVEAALTEKLPKSPRPRAGMFYCDDKGNLTRENPRQTGLKDELRERRSSDVA